MKLHLLENRSKDAYATFGGFWEKGTVRPESKFQAFGEDGSEIPVQSRITAYWPDHSVKWTAHVVDGSLAGEHLEIRPATRERVEAESKVTIEETQTEIHLSTGRMDVIVPKIGDSILRDYFVDGCQVAQRATSVFILENRETTQGIETHKEIPYVGQIQHVTIESAGELSATIKVEGIHHHYEEKMIPFVLRISAYAGSPRLDFVYTFLYDGDQDQDWLKGIGLRFFTATQTPVYQRHIKIMEEHGVFHESPALLSTWHPRLDPVIYQTQIAGKSLELTPEDQKTIEQVLENIPLWSEYVLCQDAPSHFSIKKRIGDPTRCYIDSLHGNRTEGSAAWSDGEKGLMVGQRDFWQKYPSGVQVTGLAEKEIHTTLWIYAPQTEAFFFGHYATRGYNSSYYEGFDTYGADADGIAVTTQLFVEGFGGEIVSDEALKQFNHSVQKPPVYYGEPAYYKELGAFALWAPQTKNTEVQDFLEQQLDQAFDFYQKEVEVRNWYGLFNYGDVMHSYDAQRHCWKYDMGGWAWQNTELVPTLWLWYEFMRTGREDVFSFAEAMSRHTSETDIYHFGDKKGLGSRHNVRHWGCPCKEARIAMAGHHRFLYYLTGDFRLGDVFDEVRDADYALLKVDPLWAFYDRSTMKHPTHARSGPDWSSFCSNWVTAWERGDDASYRDKMAVGIADLKETPLKLTSGTNFEYDPESGHLYYIGEMASGGSHLQICMGGPQIWAEAADLLDDEEFREMLALHGRFYFMSPEEKQEATKGLVGKREFSYPIMAAGIGAYGAKYFKDKDLAKKVWVEVLQALISENSTEGFATTPIKDVANQEVLHEIPWISTNFVSQWCLNTISALALIPEELPQTMEEVKQWLAGHDNSHLHRA